MRSILRKKINGERFYLVLGISIIFGLITTTFLSLERQFSFTKEQAGIVNKAGKQRMLSQRILLHSELAKGGKESLDVIRRDYEELRESHRYLQNRFEQVEYLPNSSMQELESDLEAFDKSVTCILSENCRSTHPSIFDEIVLSGNRFLSSMDKLVIEIERVSIDVNQKQENQRRFLKILLLLSIAAVLVIFLKLIQFRRLGEKVSTLRNFITHTPASVAIFDENMQYLGWSENWVRDYNLDGVELLGKSHYEIFPTIGDDWKQIHKECLGGKTRKCDEDHFIDEKGNEHWLRWVVKPWYDLDQEIGGIVMLTENISEKKKLSQDLERTMHDYDLILSLAPLRIIYKDTKNGIVRVNQAVADDFDVTPRAMADQPCEKFFGEELSKKYFEDDLEVISSGKPKLNIVEQMKTKDDKILWVRTNKVPYKDERGNVKGIVVYIDDITSERSLQSQLAQSQKMDAVGRLAGGIAHDFNNKLNAIIMTCNLAMEDIDKKDPHYENYDEILDASQKAADLTKQLLAFSRKQVLTLENLNLNSVVLESEKLIKRLIGESIEFLIQTQDDLPAIKGDRTQLIQVMMNLCINARDAMKKGGKLVIETALREVDHLFEKGRFSVQPGKYALLQVSDTGVGMDAETVDKIFEPFFTTKGLHEGTGLGLSTVEGIVKQSGGDILVYSEPGKGTTFNIYFPVSGESLQEGSNSSHSVQLHKGSESILLVEDEEMVRKPIEKALKKNGYAVTSFGKSEEVLQMPDSQLQDFSLLLTDIMMPGMNGKELAEKLLEKNPRMKVVFMSGYTENVIEDHGIDSEEVFVQKPVSLSVLLKTIRNALDERQVEKAA